MRPVRFSLASSRIVPLLSLILIAVLFATTIAGCAGGDHRFAAKPAGFWAGLWHGLICLITFVLSLFSDSVHIYETRNSGHGYDLGFLLGAMIFFGGSPFGIFRKRRG
jgi:hypothetical protein